jgi:hypothetical protein
VALLLRLFCYMYFNRTVEAESAPAGISLVRSHVLGRGSLLRPELPPIVHSMNETHPLTRPFTLKYQECVEMRIDGEI